MKAIICHDEDTEVYVKGQKILGVAGFIGNYQLQMVTDALRKALKKGPNTLAVHTHHAEGPSMQRAFGAHSWSLPIHNTSCRKNEYERRTSNIQRPTSNRRGENNSLKALPFSPHAREGLKFIQNLPPESAAPK